MTFKLRRNGMADSTIMADGTVISLILQGLDDIKLRVVFVMGRVQSMGAAVTGLAHHHSHQIMAVTKQRILTAGPDIKGINRGADSKILMTVQAIGLLRPGLTWTDLIS